MAERYVDPFLESLAQQKAQSQPAPDSGQNDGFFGDLIDSVQRGFYQSVGGDAEAAGQIADSDTFKNIGRDLSSRADAQTNSMTPESQQALSQRLFSEDENGDLAMGDGITNWRTWGLQFGSLSGQVLGMVGLGGGVGAVAKGAGKLALRAVAKEAMTKEAQQLVAKSAVKEAIRNGALTDVREALTSAPSREAMNAVLNNATKRLSAIGATAAAGAMGSGMRAQQARDDFMGLDAETLNQSSEFQQAYWQLADIPENQGLDTASLHTAAKEMLAEKAATTAFYDKKALLSDFASGALGGYVGGIGGVLGNAAKGTSRLGSFAKGAIIEGGTEAWQGGETQRAVNEAIKEWGDESRDPMAGVLSTRFEEGLLGGVFGGAVKAVEGPDTHTKPIVTVEQPALTGNSLLDGALAQSAANEQGRYGALSQSVDEIRQRTEGVMRSFDNPVSGNPDEPAFLRSTTFNPTGRDLVGAADTNIDTPIQQALARSQTSDNSVESMLAETVAGGERGKSLYETTLNDEGLVPEARRLSSNGAINLAGTPGDGINNNYIPPMLSDRTDPTETPSADLVTPAQSTPELQQATIPAGGAREAGVMKPTNSPVTGDPDMPAYLRQSNISDELRASAQGDTTQTPGGNVQPQAEAGVLPPRNKVVTGNPDEPAYLRQLSTLRVTKRGKPFGSEKEAQLASRANETPVELPSGGFGVADKAELEQALNQWGTQPAANFEGGMPQNNGVKFDAPARKVDADPLTSTPVAVQNQENINDNTESQAPAAGANLPSPEIVEHVTKKGKPLRGVIATGLTLEQAKEIDPYTFPKGDGHFIREQHLDKLQASENAAQPEGAPVTQADEEGFVPRDNWESNLQAAREYANHLRKTGQISEESALKAWKKLESLVGLITKATAPAGKTVDFSKAKTVKAQLDMWDSLEAGDRVIDVKGIDRGSVFGKLKSQRIVQLTNQLNERDGFSIAAITGGGSDIVAQLEARHAVNNTQQPASTDGEMTLDQLKQLRIDTINKLAQQEADNHSTDDRLQRKKDRLDRAIAEAEPKPEPKEEPAKDQFADNKLFTADRVAAARARMKSKMGNLNSGLDPEMLVDGMTIAGAYIESGIRNFSTYAKAMTDDFGDGIKPFLLSFWEGARNYPGLDTQSMTSVEDAAKQHTELMSKKAETKAKPEADNKVGTERQILRDGIHNKMANGELISNNNTLKRVAAELLGISTGELSTLQLKEAQEAYEVAAVRHRRDTIISTFNEGGSVKVAFDLAVADYEAQPNLDVRTAKSSDMQAYSTPTPMALLANIAADVWSGKAVFEPTAGNGLLLLTADSKTTYANELDPDRADSLAWSGFNVTVQDATNNPLEGMIPAKVDAVVANPPFGKYRDNDGKPARVEFEDNQGRAYSFGEIDHIIAKNALDGMKDDGKATLILGAPKEAGDYTGNNKVFLNWLYSNYNVVHHIEADGSLYKGQGAGWPTQMIVIDGRAKDGTGKFAPFKGEINRLDSWGKVYDSFNEAGLLDTKGAVFSETAGNGKLSEGYQPDTDTAASQRSDNQRSGGNGGRTGVSRSGKSGRTAGNGGRKQSGNSGSPDGTFDSQPDISGRELEQSETTPAADEGNQGGDRGVDDLGLSGQRNGDAVSDYGKKDLSTTVKKSNEFQAEYQTASEGFNEGVLTPVNMASYTQTALASIQDRHGSVDKFVAGRLGYGSKQELHKAFMGLQADAVALAVDAIERGRAIIIGDQTGVGKGRQAAGVISYALKNGKIPIFITQKPNLFTDMYDDLADIGIEDLKPLIMNQENGYISKDDKNLFDLPPKARSAALAHIMKTGKLPDGYNALFLTYSQISSDPSGGKASLLNKIAENSVMVMDESHSAAGQNSKLGLVFQGLVNKVGGLVYLSATYAKRPDNMLLYTRTDLGMAVENREALVGIIKNGGLGMQTYIAGKLAEAGQMVRRERSFEGIEIKNQIIPDLDGKTREGFDQATETLRAIQDLSSAWRVYVEEVLAKQIQEESGMDTLIAGNQADTKVDVTLFSSVVHNYIAQLSLGLKAKETARLAIEAIKRGERPVIALENTMGSALKTYMDRSGRKVGDSAADLNYSTLLKSIADGVLAYTVKSAGQKKGEQVRVKVSEINDPFIQRLYDQVMDSADAMTIDIPASPIDAIRHELAKAGYSVAEITGRDLMVDYADSGKIINRPAKEKNRRRLVDAFNSKKLDVLILNQAGSTGLSLHSSERFKDTSRRHMIVAQPSLDINTFLQMLGRVNRTGQVIEPSYSLAWLDLPSEKRPAAVLSRKMTSLSANTSGNTDSATSIEAVDILNPYGDDVVANYVQANHDTLVQYNPRLVKLPVDDQATYFLGKLAVLPSDVAEQVIGQIEKEYSALIEYLNATGQNELNITEVDLDAKPLSQRIVSEGRANAGVFAEPAYVTKVDVNAQGKAPSWNEVEAELKESSQADFDEAVARLKGDERFADRLKERIKKEESLISSLRADGKETSANQAKLTELKGMLEEHDNEKLRMAHLFSSRGTYAHGSVVRVKLPDNEESVTGIVVGLNYESDGGNPAAPSKWRLRILVADRVRALPISLSQIYADNTIEGGRYDTRENLKAIFDRASELPSRENRYIMTGNLLEAQNRSAEKGRIIPFTTQDGRVIQGMLMPKKFDPEGGSIREAIKVTSAEAFDWLTQTRDYTSASLGLKTFDGDVVIRRLYNGGYEIEMPKAVSKGKKYWGDPAMIAIIGEHAVKGGGKLNVRLTEAQARDAVKVMTRINPVTITNQVQIADYNKMTGKSVPTFSNKDIKFSKQPLNAAEKAGQGMKVAETRLAANEWLRQFKTDVQVKVAKDQAEFDQLLTELGQDNELSADEVANAAYLPESKTLLLNASAIQNPARLRQLMRHEILGHHGLEYVIGKGAVNDILQILKNGYATSKAIRDAVDTVAANYADADADTQIKEAFAHYAENRPVDKGALGRLWDRVVAAVKSALVKVGFMRANEAEQQLDSILKTIAENMRQGVESNTTSDSKALFSKAATIDDDPMSKVGLSRKPDVIDKTKERLDKLKQADRNTVKSWIDRVVKKANTEILDALAPIKYAEEQAGKLDSSDSGYVAARLSSGSSSVMQATMLHGLPQWKDGVIQRMAGTTEKDALLGIFEELGPDLHNWLAWMAGHRGEILKAEGRENLLTDKDIRELKAKGNGKEKQFNEARAKWNKLNKAVLDLGEEAGLFTKEDRAKWESEWYVPFFRESEDGDVTGPYKHKGIANQTNGIKKLKGGTANVNDLLENIFTTTSKTIDAAMKNMAAQKVVHNLAETDLIEIITKPNLMDIKAAVQNKQNLMMVKIEGEDHLIRVSDPELFRAMTMIDMKTDRGVVRSLAVKAKHLLTAGVTASPDFMLRNFIRDAMSTWAINEDGFKPLVDSIRGVKKAWKMDDSTVDMMFSGASFMGGNLRGNDPEASAAYIRKALRRKGMSPEQIDQYEKTLITNGKKAMDVIGKYWEKYERIGEAVENGSREAVYEAAIKAGKSHAQAAFEAKDLMDFSMLGASSLMRLMVDVLPFFNARMQGLGKLGRAIKANPKQIARRGGMIVGASLALLALNWEDDRYENLPDWDKDLNWHFWLGDDHFRIPKPFEIGLMFGTLPERMARAMGGKDTAGKFGEVVSRNVLETFAINPIPQVVKPLTEAYFNYDTFRGAAIENASDLNVTPEARYDERTSLLMREIGEITGMSPKKIEHVIDGYTGTMGAYAIAMGDSLVRLMSDRGESPSLRADQIPLLKSVYAGSAPAKSTQAMQDFYDLMGEANQVYATVRQYSKEGRTEEAQQLMSDNVEVLSKRKTLNKAQLQFRGLRNDMELIQRDRVLTSDQKRQRIDNLLQRRNDLAAKMISRFER